MRVRGMGHYFEEGGFRGSSVMNRVGRFNAFILIRYTSRRRSKKYSLESELERQYPVVVVRLGGGGIPRLWLDVAAIVDVALLLLEVEHDPIMETGYLPVLHLS